MDLHTIELDAGTTAAADRAARDLADTLADDTRRDMVGLAYTRYRAADDPQLHGPAAEWIAERLDDGHRLVVITIRASMLADQIDDARVLTADRAGTFADEYNATVGPVCLVLHPATSGPWQLDDVDDVVWVGAPHRPTHSQAMYQRACRDDRDAPAGTVLCAGRDVDLQLTDQLASGESGEADSAAAA